MRTLLATAVATLALVLAATPAQAEKEQHRDPAKDVVRWNSSTLETSPLPKDRTRDVVAIATDYRRERLRLVLELRRLGTQDYAVLWRIVSPIREYYLSFYNEDGTEEVQFGTPNPGRSAHPRGSGIACDGLTVTPRPASDTLVATVPYACLEAPVWVRTGATVTHWEAASLYRQEDARRDGAYRPTGAKLGPRVSYE